jgi:hypothetical protein
VTTGGIGHRVFKSSIYYLNFLANVNPNHLFRDELECEMTIRGISCVGDVQFFRKLFRSIYLKTFLYGVMC